MAAAAGQPARVSAGAASWSFDGAARLVVVGSRKLHPERRAVAGHVAGEPRRDQSRVAPRAGVAEARTTTRDPWRLLAGCHDQRRDRLSDRPGAGWPDSTRWN